MNVDSLLGNNLGTDDIYKILYSSLPTGSYVAAYGIEMYPVPTQGVDHVYDSAFTVGAWVPEPPMLPLAILGVIALGIGSYRRRSLMA